MACVKRVSNTAVGCASASGWVDVKKDNQREGACEGTPGTAGRADESDQVKIE